MSVADNFDNSIPTLNRNNTMYLSSINSQDVQMRPFKKLYTQRDWSTNLYNLDIESSMPRTFGVFTNKIDFINKVDDIEKASPKILHFPLNKPEYNLSNKDIEKSSPDIIQFKTKRNTNPLQPKYKLSKLEDYPPEIPRFIRDSMDISDIPGTNPSKQNFIKIKENLYDKLNYIEGTKTRIPYYRKNLGKLKYHYLDYSDLNSYIFKTKRNTNALDPIYIFKNKNEGTMYYHGPIEKSKPHVQYPFYYKPSLNLKLDDIKGSNPGSKNFINKFNGKNFEIYIADIEKSGAGSLKKGITTKRCLNPLMPQYQYPGEKELKDSLFNMNIRKLNNRSSSMPKINGNGIKQSFNNNIKINEKIEENKNSNSKKNVGEKNESIINLNNKDNKNQNANDKSKLNLKINNINKYDKKLFKKSNSTMYIPNSNNINKNNIIESDDEKNRRRTPLLGLYKTDVINNTFQFDRTKYGKKPKPFYGFSHDPFLQSSENLEHLDEIERKKQDKEIKKKTFSRNFLENDNNLITNEYKKNPNLLFMSDNDVYQSQNKNINNGIIRNNGHDNGMFEGKINKSTNEFGPPQKTYVEQLDTYLNNNTIKRQAI